ncbi:MAG: protein kinase, partial [Polyangiaceae bacterium]|nr:protein kinase [Polyangiaceae bacterium]
MGNRYAIQSVLGAGGMGAVFEGEQLSNGRAVAIKVLPHQMLKSRESRKRFFREVQVTASLSDANICRIYDYGTLDDGRPYYVMERLRGQPLSEHIKQRGA